MKTIHTLVADIQELVLRKDGWFSPQLSREFGQEVARRLSEKFNEPEKAPTLRLSRMGPICPCALWHSIHTPEEAEPLPPWAELKYSFGHILEALLITLAQASGHTVEGEQDEVIVDGIKGHRDCVIDGCIVDVKSMAPISFKKYKKDFAASDSFGYLDQLDGYLVGSREDPIVRVKDKAYILGIEKVLGHVFLYEHTLREDKIRARIRRHKEIVARDTPPKCECGTRPHGESGNMELDVKASYSAFKYCCFPKLRTFLYSNGPVYLTKVVRKPDVQEIDRYGNIIY